MLTHTKQEARPAVDAGARPPPAALNAGGGARPSASKLLASSPGKAAPGVVVQCGKRKTARRKAAKAALEQLIKAEKEAEQRRIERHNRNYNQELQPHRAFTTEETNGLGTARMLGHELTGNANEDERTYFTTKLAELKQKRRTDKQGIDNALRDNGQTYEEFGDKLKKYTAKLAGTQITNDKVLKELGGDYRHELDPARMQVKILRGDRHVATLHSGPSAFLSFGHSKSGRKQYYKRGDTPGKKTYVADDFGVPTRRLAYAVKSGRQLQTLAEKGAIVGRYSENHPGVDPLVPTVGELAALNYHTPGNVQSVNKQKKENRSFTLKDPPAKLSASDMLYMHQEFGSSDRQRGVSATSTIKPLLANAGEGFAGDDKEAKKLVLDLGKVRKPRLGRAPELANLHHKIPGLNPAITPPTLYKTGFKTPIGKQPAKPASNAPPEAWETYKQEKIAYAQAHDANVRSMNKVHFNAEENRHHLDWSTGKNREIFIRTVTPGMVTRQIAPEAAERFKPPAKPPKP